jgi:broad specificity phosphatase PhoE
MTCLLLIRHGQTNWNIEGRYQGQADPPLNGAGVAQAEDLAEALAEVPLAAVYASDLRRALDTARIIAERLGVPLYVRRGLREISQGVWEGMLVDDIVSNFTELWSTRHHDPAGARPPGGESVAEVAERVWATLDEISRAHPDVTVAVVSHGLALATVLCEVQRQPLTHVYELIPDNAQPVAVSWPSRTRDCG